MRCQSCDYALWNLTARICPECGRPFAPSEFDFIANSVRFCCPHCQQDYYGTGPRGHLEPVEFTCAKCNQHIHMDQMVLLPTAGVKEEQTEVDNVPWLDRGKIGFFKGWLRTVWRTLFEPARLARAIPVGSSVAQAWIFSFISNLVYLLLGIMPILVFYLMAFVSMGPRGGGAPLAGMAFGLGMALIVSMFFIAALFPIWGIVSHGLLRITGPTRQGPGASVRTLCYASGANICSAIPCVGVYLSLPGLLWTGVSAAIMLRTVHTVSWLRAFFAALAPPLAIFGVMLAWIIFAVSSTATYTAATQLSTAQASGTKLFTALAAYRARHHNQFPSHAIELMLEEDLVGSDFTTTPFGLPADPTDPILSSFQVMRADQQADAAQRLIASIPRQTIAHRLGDVVFTYHGISELNTTGSDNLWLAVQVRESPAPNQSVMLVNHDGSWLVIRPEELAAHLAEQNQLRAKLSLPPLPDPTTIRAAAPATAP